MRYKVELPADVERFVRACSPEDENAFWEALKEVRRNPIGASLPIRDPRLSRYMARFFRFGPHVAVFRLDVGRDTIRVMECRRAQPPEDVEPAPPSTPDG